MMELAALALKPEWVDVYHPVIGETGVKLLVSAQSSAEQKEHLRWIVSQLDSAPENDMAAASALSQESRINGWDGIQIDGEPLPFSREKLRELVTSDEYAWILDSVASHDYLKKKAAEKLKSS